MRVLIVEDDDAIATPLAKGLEREGLDVDRVETGEAALSRASETSFDVVLLDLGLPDRDGFDVCRELRARSDVPIIVVTARSEEVDRVVGLDGVAAAEGEEQGQEEEAAHGELRRKRTRAAICRTCTRAA